MPFFEQETTVRPRRPPQEKKKGRKEEEGEGEDKRKGKGEKMPGMHG